MLLDDAPAGRTPLALPGLDAGSHRLEVRGAGLPRPWVAALELAPGQTATLNVPLVAEGGLLAVRTEPPGAMVTLDDAPVGHTPFGPNLVSEGTHWLRVAKPGFSLGQRRVEVDGQREVDLELALEPVRLDLRVLGLSGGATVYVDGEPRPVEDGWVRGLAPGPHEVAASQEGYQVWSTRVVLQPGHPARVEAELAQVATGGGPAWWAITTSVVAGGALAGATALATGAVGDGDVVPAAGLGTLGAAAAVLAVQAWLDRPATALPAEEELELPGD